jgi:hypothetical protein
VEPREKRRDRTWRKARRTQLEHFKAVHPNGIPDCACEFSVWMFAKRKAVGSDCRKKKVGQPKIGTWRLPQRGRVDSCSRALAHRTVPLASLVGRRRRFRGRVELDAFHHEDVGRACPGNRTGSQSSKSGPGKFRAPAGAWES